jgi:two-component system OmpR family sensor kinase
MSSLPHRAARGLRDLAARTPLRTKLIASVLALVTIALVTISAAGAYVVRSYLTTERDTELDTDFSYVSNNLPPALHANVFYGYYGLQVDGQQFSSRQGLGSIGGPRQSPPELPGNTSWANSAYPVTLTAPSQTGGDTWRIRAQVIPTFPQSPQGNITRPSTGILVVGINLGNINHTVNKIVAVELLVSGVIVVVLAIAGVAIVRANLRPLEEIEETAQEIAVGHLNRRVPEGDPRTEVGSLGRSLNIMLSQIESAFRAQQESETAAHQSEERMRRFIADASHELRTPLTAIRGFAEYYRQRGGIQADEPTTRDPLTPEDLDRMMHRVEAEASRMGLLVEDLLLLARLDQQRPLEIKPVDLLTLAADAVQDARIIAPERPIDLEVAPGAAFIVNGDEARLRQVIGNLMTNALTHTPPKTPVKVTIGSGKLPGGDPAAVLSVADQGPGLSEDQARHVFERFYRADAARTRVAGGSGLGLAIVSSLVAAHGGTVSVQTAPGKGATFRVMLPLAPEARDDEPRDDP